MNKQHQKIKHLSLALLVILSLILMCASARKEQNCGLASKYHGTIALNTNKDTLTEGLKHLLNTFNDSIGTDKISYLWHTFNNSQPDSAQQITSSDIKNISVITSILKSRGYCVAMLEPATYESVDALSKLPVLILTAIIHHPDNKNALINDTNLTLNSTALQQHIDNLQIHLIDNIKMENKTCYMTTRSGLTLQGMETDKLTSQILSIEDKTTSQYLQIVDCIIVSTLPLFELQGHLNEWYASRPYRNIKPQVKEMQ